jgi:hypothetical protein
MSSVVISGDTSGTVTLQAPATAGSTVLTLPSTSGTVVTTATTTGISGSAITTGTVGVSVGGTGANTLTANNVILGNGTSAVQFVAPGSNGNVLTSNGTTWTSAAAAGGQIQTTVFTAPGTFTVPSTLTQVKVYCIGGGGGSANIQPGGAPQPGSAGNGGLAIAVCPVTAGSPIAVTVGAGGTTPGPGPQANGNAGNTSSFGSLVSSTGGGAGVISTPIATPGIGTVTTGTALNTGSNVNVISAGIAGFMPTIQPSAYGGPRASTTWSTSLGATAGTGGGTGGPAIPIGQGGSGGISGVVIVEYVG